MHGRSMKMNLDHLYRSLSRKIQEKYRVVWYRHQTHTYFAWSVRQLGFVLSYSPLESVTPNAIQQSLNEFSIFVSYEQDYWAISNGKLFCRHEITPQMLWYCLQLGYPKRFRYLTTGVCWLLMTQARLAQLCGGIVEDVEEMTYTPLAA